MSLSNGLDSHVAILEVLGLCRLYRRQEKRRASEQEKQVGYKNI